MGRKINTRQPRQPQIRVVGAGITEYWYLKHLKPLLGLRFELYPRLFGNESITNINKLIEEGLEIDAHVICLFDEDVKQWDQIEARRINDLHRKYDTNGNVTLCCSMPSIEYWFLLHYENTNRHLRTSTMRLKRCKNMFHDLLKKYIFCIKKNGYQSLLKTGEWMKR